MFVAAIELVLSIHVTVWLYSTVYVTELQPLTMQVVHGDQSGKDFPLATPAADVWALGVIAYEVLCGMSAVSSLLPLCVLCTTVGM